jgi:hypothetical protein
VAAVDVDAEEVVGIDTHEDTLARVQRAATKESESPLKAEISFL